MSDFSYYLLNVGSDKEKKRVMLEKAKENLRKFDLVGLSSRDRSKDIYPLLNSLFNLTNMSLVHKPYDHPYIGKTELTEAEARTIREYNSLDLELVEYAGKSFDLLLEAFSKCS